jgi:pyruvate dehydrogenase E1 component
MPHVVGKGRSTARTLRATRGESAAGEAPLSTETLSEMLTTTDPVGSGRRDALETIQNRVLWLSTNIIHHANKVRPNPTGVKVGGHEASSASVVSLMTALFFDFMRSGDRIAVKPHASPVLHAIHYLLGNLDAQYLTGLRQHHGLQAYPSRTKDPDPIDFSTGSVGLGSVAPNFAALVDRFVQARFGLRDGPQRRYISLLGDAELDEGSIWEAVAEPALAGLDNVIWVIDVNRQSLDRVIPGIRVGQWGRMFQANGWSVLEAKYGSLLEAAFAEPGGSALRQRIDDISNEEYQVLLRSPAHTIRETLGPGLGGRTDDEVKRLVADLGGHDLDLLHRVLGEADKATGPAVVFAYTIKGWGLPIAGDPLNHSALITGRQIDELRARLGVGADEEWSRFAPDSPAGRICNQVRGYFMPAQGRRKAQVELPQDFGQEYRGLISTQRAFGQVLTTLARVAPNAAARVVTVSPDVATSTNLGGWINKVGVWDHDEAHDLFTALGPRLIRWDRRNQGQHIELGISETNLLMMLGQLGLSAEMTGETLLPIGTIYDPFVARALDAYIYGLYSGARFILVGTPSGITLAAEGGAHQSVITPAIGLALPNVVYWEPCFSLELEWILLDVLRSLQTEAEAESAYFRLSTAAIDQSLFQPPDRELRRGQVLSGAYTLLDRRDEPGCAPGHNMVEIWATGVMVPEALAASHELLADGVFANVVNCVSPDLVYRRWQTAVHQGRWTASSERSRVPVVTVLDGHPSALAWVGSMLGVQAWPLGVTRFGESGSVPDLYSSAQIDVGAICQASFSALGSV